MDLHSVVGADPEALARELQDTGIIGLLDDGGALFDFVFDDVYDALGDAREGRDIVEEKYSSPEGTVYVLRDEAAVGRMQVMVMIPDATFVCSGSDVRA